MTFFYFNIAFQVAIGKLRLSWGVEKILWERRSPIMEKPECWGSLATISHPTPPDPQLQLELLFSLQNVIIYHKMDIIKSAWINPGYCIPIRIKWICKSFNEYFFPSLFVFHESYMHKFNGEPCFLNTSMINLCLS